MNDSLAPRAAALKPDQIAPRVLAWWDVHRRELPWRARAGEKPDPYRVWLSEILLQQTTAAAAAPYFLKFLAKWPRVEALAAAPLDEIMGAFAGLGYYSRARNLHACAQEVARRGGRFPQTEAELRALPGLGAYTAAAVAAIAFDAKGGAGRRQYRAHLVPALRNRNADRCRAPPDRRGRGFADAGRSSRRLRAGADGHRRDDLPAAQSRLRRLPAARGAPPWRWARPPPFPAAAPSRRSRFASARPFSRVAPTAPSSRAAARPRDCSARRSNCREVQWRAGEPAGGVEDAPFAARGGAPGDVEQVFTHFTLRLTLYVAEVGAAPPQRERGAMGRAARRGERRLFERDAEGAVAEVGVAMPQFEGAIWVALEDAASAGFSSVMLKALAHAGRFADVGKG